MRFAQILHNKVHWIFESEEQPEFAPNIMLVNITDNPEVQEGWDYDSLTNSFKAPVAEENVDDLLVPTADELLDAKVELKVIETLIEMGVI